MPRSMTYSAITLVPLLVLAAVAMPVGVAGADDDAGAATLGDALEQGKFGLDLNYRFEWVDEEGFADDGLASTLRTVLSYRSRSWHDVGVYLEAEDVTDVGLSDEHNNAGQDGRGNGVSDRPVIADAPGTELNQVYLDLGFVPKSSLKLGRQELVLGNVRFVGNVGWRQNHQSFDAASFTTKAIPHTALSYAYVAKVQRIFGDTQDMSSHLLQADVGAGGVGTLSAYAFLLDYQAEAQLGLSTSTCGLRLAGGRPLGGAVTALWDLELAQQQDWADNPAEVDAGYWRAELGAELRGVTVKLGHELLEGDLEHGRFTTPLATLHAWNGWADRFLNTPSNGLADSWVAVSGKLGAVALSGVYHLFDADSGGADYGSELDLLAVYTTSWKQRVGVKLAAYDADQHSTDVTKGWVWTSWAF